VPTGEAIELAVAPAKSPREKTPDEIKVEEFKKEQLTRSRVHTCYQILLTLGCIIAYSVLFTEMGWLTHIDKYDLPQHPPRGANSVNSLIEAFVVDKKSGAMSYPDIVYFQFPDEHQLWFGETHGQWMWCHGALYAALPSALLHGISAGMMDPVYYTTMLAKPEPDSECLKVGGDRTACLYELVGVNEKGKPFGNESPQVDLKKRLPADGYFAFVMRESTDLWKIKLNTGVGRGLHLVPKTMSSLAGSVEGLTFMSLLFGIAISVVICAAANSYAKSRQRNYLREYIAQGLFLHNEKEAAEYDLIQQEEIMMEDKGEDEEAWEYEANSSDDDSSDEEDQSNEAVAQRRRERMERRMMDTLNKEQGVLHFVGNQVNGTGGVAIPPMAGSTIENIGPTVFDQLMQRTQTTLAHIALLALSCLPVTLFRVLYFQGVDRFGYLGMDSGILGTDYVIHTVRFMFLLSFALFNILLVGLMLHYFFAEFDGERFPWLKQFTRSPFAKWLLVQWTGFSYLQFACFFMSVLVTVVFIINAAIGLLLHFFTNMFMVTALLGTGAAIYANFQNLEGVINEVHSNISSSSVIMEDLKEGLTRRIVEITVSEQKMITDKKALKERLIAKGLLDPNVESTSAWSSSCAAALTPGRMDEEDQALYDAIEEKQAKMTAGFSKADDSGDGLVTREELELQFGKISSDEWLAFDENDDGDCSIEEWQKIKVKRAQKMVLTVRSAFQNCVEKELGKQGFDKSRIIKLTMVGSVVIVAVLITLYFAMDAANAFGAMAAMVSSMMGGAAIGFLNMPKKKGKVDPKIEKAIAQLNKALQKTIQNAVETLAHNLRFFPVLIEIMDNSIKESEDELAETFASADPKLKKVSQQMVDTARKSLAAQKVKNNEATKVANEIELAQDPENQLAWENLAELGRDQMKEKDTKKKLFQISDKKYSIDDCFAKMEELSEKKLAASDSSI
jgi:hypothetical protein